MRARPGRDCPGRPAGAVTRRSAAPVDHGVLGEPHFPPKVRRIIYLFMSGAPSQLDLLDYKPLLNQRHGEQLPDSVRGGQRLTGMSGNQSSIPLVGSPFKFQQHGEAAPGSANCCRTRPRSPTSCASSARCSPKPINHGPGVTFLQTGSQIAGRPSMGAWLSYGLGQENAELAVVRRADHQGQGRPAAGVAPVGERVLADAGIKACCSARRRIRCCISTTRPASTPRADVCCSTGCASCTSTSSNDRPTPKSQNRIDHYEMAFAMQSSIPEVVDISARAASGARLVWARRHDARHVRGQLPAGPATGRARRAVHPALSSGLGPSRRACPRRCRSCARRPISRPRPWSRI